jgi:hypothetical protein
VAEGNILPAEFEDSFQHSYSRGDKSDVDFVVLFHYFMKDKHRED